MPLDAEQVGSPGWWLHRLGTKLHHDAPRVERLWNYYEGNHPLPPVAGIRSDEYHGWMRAARANWVELVVESVRERLSVVGFRVGDEGPEGDREADEIWQRNSLDADHGLVHQAAFVAGRAYTLVGVNPDEPGRALITPEHPGECITEGTPGNPRKRAAGLKMWRDDWTGGWRASLYLPDVQYSLVAERDPQWGMALGNKKQIPWRVEQQARNAFGVVPIVPFINKATLNRAGAGEFEAVTDIQDRINASLINLISAMRYGAFRQRWATGLEVDVDPITGLAVDPFKLDITKLWAVPAPDVQFGDFTETRLDGYIQSVREGVKDLAAITRTPPHYLLGEVVNATGDALKAAEAGLTSKARDRQLSWGEGWEETMRLAGMIENHPELSEAYNAETIWRDPETRSLSELADAAMKLKNIGYPFRHLAEKMGETPAQIDRMQADKATEDLLTMQQTGLDPALARNAANPPPPPPSPFKAGQTPAGEPEPS